MRQKSFQVNIPKPCNENWNKMTPQTQGRHCTACNHTVVDFTKMTDKEVLHFFQNTQGRVCGHFKKTQIERPLLLPKPVSTHRSAAVGLLLSSLLVATSANAQQSTAKKTVNCNSPKTEEPKLMGNIALELMPTITENIANMPVVTGMIMFAEEEEEIEIIVEPETQNLLDYLVGKIGMEEETRLGDIALTELPTPIQPEENWEEMIEGEVIFEPAPKPTFLPQKLSSFWNKAVTSIHQLKEEIKLTVKPFNLEETSPSKEIPIAATGAATISAPLKYKPSLQLIQKVYPNPTTDKVQLDLESAIAQEVQLLLYNQLGQVIGSQKIALQKGQNQHQLILTDFSGTITNTLYIRLIQADKTEETYAIGVIRA